MMASSEIPAALQRVSAPCTAGRAPAPPRSHPAGAMRCAWTRAGPHPACAHGELQALGWVHRRAWDCMLHACKQIGAHVKGTCRSSLCLFNFFGGVGMQVPSLGPCHRTRVAPRPPAHLCQHRRAAQALARTRPGKSALRQPCAYSGARRGLRRPGPRLANGRRRCTMAASPAPMDVVDVVAVKEGPSAARARALPTATLVHHGRIACASSRVQKPPGGPNAQQRRPGKRGRSLSASSAQHAPRLCPVSTNRQPCTQAVPRQHQPPAPRPGYAPSAPAASPASGRAPLLTALPGDGGAGADAGGPGVGRPAGLTGQAHGRPLERLHFAVQCLAV